tara:strand:+ start:2940 stop:4154 length:1215 start_codon:yes stop_codon:yes gene_type:complete
MMQTVRIRKTDYEPRKYEERSLHGEAVENRNPIIKEAKIRSIYEDDEIAIIHVMHKWDASYNEMGYVLMGDTLTKSHEVYAYIDSVVKAPAGGLVPGMARTMTGAPNEAGNPTASNMQDPASLGLPGYNPGMGGGASQGTAGGNQASHPAAQSQPGMWDRFKTWGKERAMPAMGRGLRHLGAFGAGGLAAGPAGALAGLGGSMYQAHQAKKNPGSAGALGAEYGKVVGGPGGAAELGRDAAKQGAQAAGQFAGQQAQNFQQGGGVAGKVGQAAYAGQNLASQAGAGLKRLGGAIAAPFQQAWQAGGGQQQANAMNAGAPAPTVGVTQQGQAPSPATASQQPPQSAVSSIQQNPTATADPTQAAAITGGQQGGYQHTDPYAQGGGAASSYLDQTRDAANQNMLNV